MKFTKKTDYALRTMQYLARAPGSSPVAVRHIADKMKLSLKFLQLVVSDLAKAKLILTVPGPGGGVSLSRESETINVLEIIEAVEGRIDLMECFEHPESCQDYCGCNIVSTLQAAQAAMVNYLRNSSLKLMVVAKKDPFDLVREGHSLKPQFGCPVIK